jgi:hypothetical protein
VAAKKPIQPKPFTMPIAVDDFVKRAAQVAIDMQRDALKELERH